MCECANEEHHSFPALRGSKQILNSAKKYLFFFRVKHVLAMNINDRNERSATIIIGDRLCLKLNCYIDEWKKAWQSCSKCYLTHFNWKCITGATPSSIHNGCKTNRDQKKRKSYSKVYNITIRILLLVSGIRILLIGLNHQNTVGFCIRITRYKFISS